VRRRIVRLAVTPEQIGLCGCWQIIAVHRESIQISLGCNAGELREEISYYVSSLRDTRGQDDAILQAIRGHWEAIENGSHYRRDVSFGEDQSRIKNRGAAQVMAALRNLALGFHELRKAAGKTKKGAGVKNSCRKMTFSQALAFLNS
jgi:predicted transposase YbfD/YdcC